MDWEIGSKSSEANGACYLYLYQQPSDVERVHNHLLIRRESGVETVFILVIGTRYQQPMVSHLHHYSTKSAPAVPITAHTNPNPTRLYPRALSQTDRLSPNNRIQHNTGNTITMINENALPINAITRWNDGKKTAIKRTARVLRVLDVRRMGKELISSACSSTKITS